MLVYRDLTSAATASDPSRRRVVTVGFFDGLHIGHQKILAELKSWARELGAEPVVVTFDRHPQEVVSGQPPMRILSLDHRLLLLAREGIAVTLVLNFDAALSRLSADDFVRRVFRESLGAGSLLMGFDGAFGYKRQGTFEYVRARAERLGMVVRQARAESLQGERVSSTLVRQAIRAGDLSRLEALLGRPFSILGQVRKGEGRGRLLGFPTANLDTCGEVLPPTGVYFAETHRLGRSLESCMKSADAPTPACERLGSVVNIGLRPTFNAPDTVQSLAEVHLLDWEGSLYDEYLEVHFLAHHRAEKKFPSADALVAQIREDVAGFKAWRK
jgi:riboflavin kinase/FMN adenylyltransferase